MTQSFIGQIQPYAFAFAPRLWAQCNGQTLGIAQNTALFSLLGAMYGGNGTTTFALPNLQSRVPLHMGNYQGTIYAQGEMAGEENVTLTLSELPSHNHAFVGSSDNANDTQPAANTSLAKIAKASGTADNYYVAPAHLTPLNPASIGPTGGNLSHPNIQPYLAINWCICQQGIYPSRN